jgi:hypothetical protein
LAPSPAADSLTLTYEFLWIKLQEERQRRQEVMPDSLDEALGLALNKQLLVASTWREKLKEHIASRLVGAVIGAIAKSSSLAAYEMLAL